MKSPAGVASDSSAIKQTLILKIFLDHIYESEELVDICMLYKMFSTFVVKSQHVLFVESNKTDQVLQ